jgi:small subunit ribosomal protein S3Ae
MDITRDKLCSMIKKWQTTIECQSDVKTNDGYILRIFTIGFTKRGARQQRKTSYAQHSQIKEIRRKINNILSGEIAKVGVADLVQHLTTDTYTELIT